MNLISRSRTKWKRKGRHLFKGIVIVPILVVFLWTETGCFTSRRRCCVAEVKEIGRNTKTAHRYALFTSGKVPDYFLHNKAVTMFPGVFGEDGIPVLVERNVNLDRPSFALGPFGLILPIPDAQSECRTTTVTLSLLAAPRIRTAFIFRSSDDIAYSFWIPTAYLYFRGSSGEPWQPCFDVHSYGFCDVGGGIGPEMSIETWFTKERGIEISGIAAKLKEMEDQGRIDDAVVRKSKDYRVQMGAQQQKARVMTTGKQVRERPTSGTTTQLNQVVPEPVKAQKPIDKAVNRKPTPAPGESARGAQVQP